MAKCKECGYLAVRDRATGRLREAEDRYRETGAVSQVDLIAYGIGEYPQHEQRPVCLTRAYDLRKEIDDRQAKDGKEPDIVKEMVAFDRPCEQFTEWDQGFTPKEHREMIDRKDSQKLQEQQRRSERRWRLIEVLILVLTGAVVAIIAALVERGTLFGGGS